MKNKLQKVRYFSTIDEFFITTLAAQTVQFMLTNLPYRSTVYKTGT